MFPLPAERNAVGVHKKHFPKGAAAGALARDKDARAALRRHLPGLDLDWPGLRVHHLDPPVLTVDNFFTPEECDTYQAWAESQDAAAVHALEQSATFSAATAQARTSRTWFLAYEHGGVPLLARARALLGVEDLGRFEEPQLVRYAPGQYFSWHYDAVPPTMLVNGGQRVCTLLVYLNDVPEGGRTAFRDLRAGGTGDDGKPRRLAVAPKRGTALLFCPADAEGTADDRTLHAGEPTEATEDKWIAQLWLHESAYRASAPPGNSQEKAAAAVEAFAKEHGLT